MTDIDFRNQLQPTLRGLLDILPEQIPMLRQSSNRQTAHGDVLPHEKARSEPLAIPLVGADGADDVLSRGERHVYANSRRDNCARPSNATTPSSSVAAL